MVIVDYLDYLIILRNNKRIENLILIIENQFLDLKKRIEYDHPLVEALIHFDLNSIPHHDPA